MVITISKIVGVATPMDVVQFSLACVPHHLLKLQPKAPSVLFACLLAYWYLAVSITVYCIASNLTDISNYLDTISN